MSSPPPATGYRLTVIQAEPLRYLENESQQYRSIDQLDFRRERETLEKALNDAKSELDLGIDIVFKHETTDSVSAAVTTGGQLSSHVLHLSSHGTSWSLALEDGSRGAQFVEFSDIASLIVSGSGEELKFVFISACHSRKLGEELVHMGVPHVLCCEQQTEMKDDAIIEFSRVFYRALACGKTLQAAFDHGKDAVRLSPEVPESERTIDNYVLLPESDNPDWKYHDVPVFLDTTTDATAATTTGTTDTTTDSTTETFALRNHDTSVDNGNFVEIERSSTGHFPQRTWKLKAWFAYPDGRRVLVADEKAGPTQSNVEMVNRLIERLENHKDDDGTPRPLRINQNDWNELQEDIASNFRAATAYHFAKLFGY